MPPQSIMVITSLLWSSNRRRFTSASVPATTAMAIMATAGMGIGTLATIITMAMVGIMVEADITGADIMVTIDK